MLTNEEAARVETQLAVCIQEEERLNDWEKEFITSISDQFTNNGHLSPKQLENLKKIYDKVV